MPPSSSSNSIQLEEGCDDDRLELPGQPYAFALWNLIIRPPRRRYEECRLGPRDYRLWSCGVHREDMTLRNQRGMQLKCSWFRQQGNDEAGPCVIYLHQNASCRLEALQLVPLFLPLGISLFAFDFAGCGESDGEYISLGWYERDDLADCIDYLRKSEKVSAIGLWGRSMGAVTSLLHADRDHSIAGMVLDSPFCNLRQLATELAQSDFLQVKVPTWLLSGALALGRMRIKSLCNFDIDNLAPERHVDASFIPAFFIAGRGDDFILPHHTQKLFDNYGGDKELELVEGDHNSPRHPAVNRKAVLFFCRAFRCDPTPPGMSGGIAGMLGFDGVAVDCATSRPVIGRDTHLQVARVLATAGDSKAWLGRREHPCMPFRIEGALQLGQATAQAGFCCCFVPSASDWGGCNRPPVVFFACVTTSGLCLLGATGQKEPDLVVSSSAAIELNVPVLFTLEFFQRPTRVVLALGDGGAEIKHTFDEEYDAETMIWPVARNGEATFFDYGITSLTVAPVMEDDLHEFHENADQDAEEQAQASEGAGDKVSLRGGETTDATVGTDDRSSSKEQPGPSGSKSSCHQQ